MNNDEQAIRELVQTWMDATKKGDTARVLQLMADDVIFMVPGAGYTLTILRKEPQGKWLLAHDANLVTPRNNS
jgi:ketosteroid isomerase-like protein